MWNSAVVSRVLFAGLALSSVVAAVPGKSKGGSQQEPPPPKGQSFKKEYDFIIVGGGTAGLVLADRLTESGKFEVVVLEYGGLPTDVESYSTAGGNQYLGSSQIDYGFSTVPQPQMGGRIMPYHRGRCLGGSSAINGLYYGRGTSTIYDKWESLGNPGWSWEDVHPLFIKASFSLTSTTFVGNPAHSTDPRFETHDANEYSNGPLQVGYQGFIPKSNVPFIKACNESVHTPILHDLNSGDNRGVKQGTMTFDANFMRSSSYDSYYMRAKDRPNLTTLIRAPVLNVNFEGEGEDLTAVGITFLDESSGLVSNITAKREVILSAGAFHSPALMMVSGIGPQAELESVGITPILVNENIGQHMNDHNAFSVIARVKPEASTSDIGNDLAVLQNEQKEFYFEGFTERWHSRWSAPSGCTNCFQELPDEELRSFGAQEIIDLNITNQAHIEYLYESIAYPGGANKFFTPLPNESYISMTASNLAATSRGNVTIGSRSILDYPTINPAYFTTDVDRKMAIHSFKYLRALFKNPNLSVFLDGPDAEVAPGSAVQSDDDILDWVYTNVLPNWHASGTNQMIPKDKGGVVDPRLRVYGVKNLRICDVSIIPFLPDVNIVGPVYMIGEKGSELIREDHGDL
ncbi:GMC oxidoreductase [Rhizodiscina lignyota]|uniref:GMC oxidoreductase n=1 Tax=Rhizodiscina lignyota TaxID=1504668 RepID=A0A9P4M9W7_9PEZI|nr:GMC oxidoreductase [Rhizodiscina lignyota]